MSFGDPPFFVGAGVFSHDQLAQLNIQPGGFTTITTNITNPLAQAAVPMPQPGINQYINQYRSQVERLLPLNPKPGQTVSLWFDGNQWVKLADRPFVYPGEGQDGVGSFTLDELSLASDMIDEIEHGRRA